MMLFKNLCNMEMFKLTAQKYERSKLIYIKVPMVKLDRQKFNTVPCGASRKTGFYLKMFIHGNFFKRIHPICKVEIFK